MMVKSRLIDVFYGSDGFFRFLPSPSEILAVQLHALHPHGADGDTSTKRGFALTMIGLSTRNEFVHKIGAAIALALSIIYIASLFLKLD
jgi:hypothetical protein